MPFVMASDVIGETAFLGCDPCESSEAWDPEPGLALCPTLPAELGAVPRWVGLLPYEACRPLERGLASDLRPEVSLERPRWWRYGAVVRLGRDLRLLGDDPSAVDALAERLLGGATLSQERAARWAKAAQFGAVSVDSDEAHVARVRRALELIGAGELYQINLARRFRLQVSGRGAQLVCSLLARSSAPFGFSLDMGEDGSVAGSSPELCLDLAPDRRLLTCPIKGTRPRGASAADDARLRESLAADPKELAELAMVVDLERNDLGRVAEVGSVCVNEPGRIETHSTVHHRVARVTAKLRPEVTRSELLTQFLPSGSVTGTPKRRAMEWIAALEPERRGLYTGAYGWLAHDGGLRLAMAIRTLVTGGDGQAEYWAGGGIVADSVPQRETDETRWKARQIGVSADGRPSDFSASDSRDDTHRAAENWARLADSATERDRTHGS